MPITIVSPLDETIRVFSRPALRLETLTGKTIGLLDISKPGGSIFLYRIELLLKERFKAAHVVRVMKPTYTKPAPEAVIAKFLDAKCDAVIEALAD